MFGFALCSRGQASVLLIPKAYGTGRQCTRTAGEHQATSTSWNCSLSLLTCGTLSKNTSCRKVDAFTSLISWCVQRWWPKDAVLLFLGTEFVGESSQARSLWSPVFTSVDDLGAGSRCVERHGDNHDKSLLSLFLFGCLLQHGVFLLSSGSGVPLAFVSTMVATTSGGSKSRRLHLRHVGVTKAATRIFNNAFCNGDNSVWIFLVDFHHLWTKLKWSSGRVRELPLPRAPSVPRSAGRYRGGQTFLTWLEKWH